MKATDTPPCPHCGGALTETCPDADVPRWDYDCATCAWHGEYPEPLFVADATWTRAVWSEVERVTRASGGDAWSLSPGDQRYTAEALLRRVVAIAVSRETSSTPAWVRVREVTGLGSGFSQRLLDWADEERPHSPEPR